MSIWRIDYDNDTGSDDDYFAEWWIVTNDIRSFECRSQDDANWLLDLLLTQAKEPA